MATTNDEIITHITSHRDGFNDAINDVQAYVGDSAKWTASAKTAQLALITTVRAQMLHASNCAVCKAWDGSTS